MFSKTTAVSLATFVVCILLFNHVAEAQNFRVKFKNTMQSTSDVVLTPRDGGAPITFAVGQGNTVDLEFTSDVFNLQVVPRDEPIAGYRMQEVNFRDEAALLNGNPFILKGIFAKGKLVKRRGCFCRCRYVRLRGERIAVTLSAQRADGSQFFLRSSKELYPFE